MVVGATMLIITIRLMYDYVLHSYLLDMVRLLVLYMYPYGVVNNYV